jgi:hypothetical protein
VRNPIAGARRPVLPILAVIALAGCATSGKSPPPEPTPAEIQRGWQVYVYGADGSAIGRTSLPQHPADRTRPDEILPSIGGAFCVPVLDPDIDVSDKRLRKFCRGSDDREGRGRVVLAPGWDDAVPAHPACFIHCVCEGYAARGDDAAELAKESDKGGCSNRLNCRLDCPPE